MWHTGLLVVWCVPIRTRPAIQGWHAGLTWGKSCISRLPCHIWRSGLLDIGQKGSRCSRPCGSPHVVLLKQGLQRHSVAAHNNTTDPHTHPHRPHTHTHTHTHKQKQNQEPFSHKGCICYLNLFDNSGGTVPPLGKDRLRGCTLVLPEGSVM